jgi:broad specificity phosphatase PhoE
MKIIIIRHGKRFDSPVYFTPLTAEGLYQADEVVDVLKSYDIDIIYSSPFLRVLQTVYPFCVETDKSVRVENAFYESMDSAEFTYSNCHHNITELKTSYPYILDVIDCNYKSRVAVSNISYTEEYNDIKNRVFPFIYSLCKEYKKTDKTILIVTHQTIVNTVKKFFDTKVLFTDHVEETVPYVINVPEHITGPV